jgi:Gpi18-like mannosyltransferase/predicted membrane-bound dolichyl-phosphate-mannose-protein mannosyltransferase
MWLAAVSGAIAIAAAPLPAAPTGNIAGLVAGVILFAIVCYAFADLIRPLWREAEFRTVVALLVLIGLIKLALLPLLPGFGIDVGTYEAWALQIADHGPAQTYQAGYFLDYPPGYLYALWVVGFIARAFDFGGEYLRVIVESPPLLADFALALVMYAFVRRGENARAAMAALLMIALNPALLYDTIVWGQSDSVLTLTTMLTLTAILARQFEVGWALAAISLLVKPQGVMILPMLALWTMLETGFSTWVSSAAAFVGAFFIGISPFQIGHPWNWIIQLYVSTGAYYHETSVNAFNLMALIGGLRNSDLEPLGPITYFSLGLSMLVPLYAYVGWIVWRGRSARRLIFAAFFTIFGFFMVAPRMHERYIYPAAALAVPLALESPEMLLVFGILTVTACFNLAYVLHILRTVVFMDGRDSLAMLASGLNVVALAISAYYGAARLDYPAADEGILLKAFNRFSQASMAGRRTHRDVTPADEPEAPPLKWIRPDTAALVALVAAAAFTRFWHLGRPPEIVFDEVHFVAQARHYLRGEPFLDPHPPLAKLVIAAGIYLFGDHPWSWRVGNAVLGTFLVGITYLLGRELTRSRVAATLAAIFVMCDGMFLVDSRVGVIDIVYLTCAAAAYWLFFVYARTSEMRRKRLLLVAIGVALGLCLGAKLYVPAVTFLLVTGFILYAVARDYPVLPRENVAQIAARRELRLNRSIGALAIVGGVAAIFYVGCFLPHYLLGWWRGIEDLFKYYNEVRWYESSVASATHPYASPWWSWPLMLRPIAYWQNFPQTGPVATIWGGGNPLLWWGALTAITIMLVRAIEVPTMPKWFVVIGYVAYLAIWTPIGRTLFLYHYMPAVYMGYLALAMVLAGCWEGRSEPWEHAALLLTIAPALILGLGFAVGTFAVIAIAIGYVYTLVETDYAGKYVCGLFVAGALILFVYYYPVWTAMKIERSGYYARMWLSGTGLRNWI